MRLLLDTHIFLWFLDDERRIPDTAREAIHAEDNDVLVSAVAIWEVAIKASLGRLDIAADAVHRLPRLIESSGFEELPVGARHATAVHDLPWHHRDPFDRLMVAQARLESLTLVSTDPQIRRYDVSVL